MHEVTSTIDNLFCFSHLRWNFVYQRPQHLMSRFAAVMRVFFVEEPIYGNSDAPKLDITIQLSPKVTVIVPQLPSGTTAEQANNIIQTLLEEYIEEHQIQPGIFWYYSPMALKITRDFSPLISVYDCMDELTGFLFAPPELAQLETELFSRVDAVFTGGNTLYQAKKQCHNNVHAFPSSIDKAHFAKARSTVADPADQAAIPHPRIGFYGVLDERLDLGLIEKAALLRPDWNFIFIGPVVKIDSRTLPVSNNIHYLGGRSYAELPSYLSGWDVAMMPFARNASTKFISPTKTPEYLAGGKQVISTSIADVVNDYGNHGLVEIADTAEDFVSKVERMLSTRSTSEWLIAVDKHLAAMSWDNTWERMMAIIVNAAKTKTMLKNKNTAHV